MTAVQLKETLLGVLTALVDIQDHESACNLELPASLFDLDGAQVSAVLGGVRIDLPNGTSFDVLVQQGGR